MLYSEEWTVYALWQAETEQHAMSNAIHIQTTILPGGKIEVSAPELPPGKRANVFVVVEDEEPQEKRPVREILANLSGHRLFQSAEEVDAYIRGERDSWER
jgi:hypothetical protein